MLTLFLNLFLFPLGMTNTFSLEATHSRFQLKITPQNFSYEGEHLKHSGQIQECNRKIYSSLNSELFAKLPSKNFPKGLPVRVDNQVFTIDPKSSLAQDMMNMDQKMAGVLIQEKKNCQN